MLHNFAYKERSAITWLQKILIEDASLKNQNISSADEESEEELVLPCPINDIALQYDLYYSGGENSMYNKRFGLNKVALREAELIEQSFKSVLGAIKKNNSAHKVLRILDFGCGDGRLFLLLEELSNRLIGKEFNIELVGYDPSKVGIDLLSETLLQDGFKKKSDFNSSKKRYFSKNNFSVTLVLGDVEEGLEATKELIGPNIDLCLCMFGVIGHVPGRQRRINTLAALGELLSPVGELLISICATKVFAKEMAAYEEIRKQYKIHTKHNMGNSAKVRRAVLRLAKEEGDLYYCSNGGPNAIDNYVHLYSPQELKEDLKRAHFCTASGIKILTLSHQFEICNNSTKAKLDNIASRILSVLCFSDYMKNFFGKYLFIKCSKL